MPQTMMELYDAASRLPEEERAELAEMIGATIPPGPSALHPSWAEELRRRADDLDSGRVQTIPAEIVRQRIRDLIESRDPQHG